MKDISERSSTVSTSLSRPRTQRISTTRTDTSTCRSHEFLRGERVSQSAMTPLSALYKSSYPKYPAFPSIYETKYAHDFKYSFWPVERCKREHPPPLDNSKFKFGKSHYAEEFHPKEPVKNTKFTPVSRHRMNNPHPRVRVVQDYPDAQRWVWSSPEQVANTPNSRTSTTAERVRKWQRNSEPKWHRWNSR